LIRAPLLGLLTPCVAQAEDYPVRFGESRDGSVIPALTLDIGGDRQAGVSAGGGKKPVPRWRNGLEEPL
jgi:hypothetical protein